MFGLGQKFTLLFIESVSLFLVVHFGQFELLDGLFLFGDFLFELGDLVDDLVEFLFSFQ